MKFSNFTNEKNPCLLHGQLVVMVLMHETLQCSFILHQFAALCEFSLKTSFREELSEERIEYTSTGI